MMKNCLKILVLFAGFTWAMNVYAAGSLIVGALMGSAWVAANVVAATVIAFAINMVVSAVITKALYKDPSGPAGASPNPGNRQQVAPATDNKLPVVYGQAWVGGTIVDLSITNNNQVLYYVLALSEVTNTNDGQTGDAFTFGDIYYGGKKVTFKADGYTVASLTDESTGEVNTQVADKIAIYLYRNGSNTPTNSSQTAIQVMSDANLVYKWDSTKLMTNCAFAILKLTYNADARITGIEQTKFQVINPRHKPGECFLDYMTNTRYGAALPLEQVNTDSLTELDAYCDQSFTYTTFSGLSATETRFRFDGVVDTSRTIMQTLQDMAACCDCLLRYNEITAQWGVIVQKPSYEVAMAVNDSNIVSAIQITPIDIASTYNIIEVKFPDKQNQDAFNSATFDLAEIDPVLLFPNEPVNKQSVSLPFVNNDVRAQYIANRLLKNAREDLQVDCSVNFTGIALEAGDVVTLTNVNYGWLDKLFRLTKVTETFNDDGSVVVKLLLQEYNPSIYDDAPITQFTPAPNTGIGAPLFFGELYAPTVAAQYPNATTPSVSVQVTTSSSGITQYAEIWYSAFANPTASQLIFAGTSEVQSNGTPWQPSAQLPLITLTALPAGNWYLFTRMVNSLGTSNFSTASAVLQWRPTTFQFSLRWLSVRYADSITGTGFSANPRNKTFFGLQNVSVATGSESAADYVWYPGTFSTASYLLFANRQNRKFSFAVGGAGFNNLGGAFVPSETSVYDTSVWGALQDGQNYIDLDLRTGQLTQAGTTATSSADGLLSVTNNTNGSMIIALEKFLNFGNGVYSKNFNAATLTVDVYGRVVGFSEPDSFYFTESVFSATAGQTSFSVTHVVGQSLVFRDGVLVPTSEFTETSTTIVLTNACAAGEIIIVLSMRAISTSVYYEILNTTIASSTSNSITYVSNTPQPINAGDLLCFASAQPAPTDSPITYTVQSVNTATKTITFTGAIAGATAGFNVYRKRAAGSSYAPFTRYAQDVSGITTFAPPTYAIQNGFESIYVNGVQINEADYDIVDGALVGFPGPITGKLEIIMFAPNNYNVPASNVTNNTAYSVADALSYSFPNNPLAMEVYANGAILTKGSSYDYTATSSGYNLTAAIPNNYTLLNQQTFARDGAV